MPFLETTRLPTSLSAWLVGGRNFETIVVETYGGLEYREQPWQYPRGVWSITEALRAAEEAGQGYGVRSLLNFFMNGQGRFNGFRVKVPNDNSDNGDGVLGTTGLAVASTTAYQMFKNYVTGSVSYQGIVLKPIATVIDTHGAFPDVLIKVYNNGVLQTISADYTINTATGLVTFTSQPTIGHTLTWTGSYDISCRFGDDAPQIGLDPGGALSSWPNLNIVELKNP